MNHRHRHLSVLAVVIAALALAVLAPGYRADNATLAFVNKIIFEVQKRSAENAWAKASSGDVLTSGDQVRTGKRSLAIIKFLDASIIRLRELSLLTLTGDGPRGSMIKSAQLSQGSLGFDIRKQQSEQFRLTSPTSVASIRGTNGKWTGGGASDTLIILEGLVNLKNNTSGNSVDVAAGSIGFSNSDGSVSSRKATQKELADASEALTGGSPNELKLELRDSKGNQKELKLKFRK